MKVITHVLSLGIFITLLATFSSCTQKTEQVEAVKYGVYDHTYEIPDVPGTVYYVSPDGDAAADGLTLENPTTIYEAFKKVVTGDAIIMRGGLYRAGDITFNQGITIQPYMDEKPVMNGTMVVDSWEKVSDTLWVTDWDRLFPDVPMDWWNRWANERSTPLHRFNGDVVFIDGQFLESAGSTEEVDEGTFYVDYEGKKIYIGVNPEGRFVEITAFRKAIYRTLATENGKEPDKRGPVIKGITFTQYADTMVHIGGSELAIDQHGRDIVGTTFENCTFSTCFKIGMFAISDSLVMRNCNVVNTNTEGIYVVASADVLLERNIIENNNIEKWTGYYPSAVKIFNQSHNAVFRDNLVKNQPNSNGVWWDVGNHDGVFVNNHCEDIAQSALFFEISEGLTAAGNTFINCDQALFALNAKDVKLYNNTLINSRANFRRDSRGDQLGVFGWHVTTGPGVEERGHHTFVNNLVYMTSDKNSAMLQTGQPANLCERLSNPLLDVLDYNVYVRDVDAATEEKAPLMNWAPYPNERCNIDIFTPAELNEIHTNFAANSQYLENIEGSLFVDMANNDFNVANESVLNASAKDIPAEVLEMMGLDAGTKPFIGAVAP